MPVSVSTGLDLHNHVVHVETSSNLKRKKKRKWEKTKMDKIEVVL